MIFFLMSPRRWGVSWTFFATSLRSYPMNLTPYLNPEEVNDPDPRAFTNENGLNVLSRITFKQEFVKKSFLDDSLIDKVTPLKSWMKNNKNYK